jgi:hypothetical protein
VSAGVVAPLHLGALHPFETVLLFLIAFGPFVVLLVVVARQRRRADAEPGERAEPTGATEVDREG